MTEKQLKLLELLKKDNTLYSLSDDMNLSPKQIYRRIILLNEAGYNIKRNDYSNGDISFRLSNTAISNKIKRILSPANQNEFIIAAISDLHLGNCQQNIKAINIFIEYCIKNNIKIVFNIGDIFQGFLNSTQLGHKCILDSSCEEQFNKYINIYPLDSSITNYAILGNHDANYLNSYLNILKMIKNKRYDFVTLGYNNGIIQIKNEEIALSHEGYNPKQKRILIQGHSHESKIKMSYERMLGITIPTLSNVSTNSEITIPQFCILNLIFDESGYVNTINVQNYLILEDKTIKINEFKTSFNNHLDKDKKYTINNIEESPKVKRLIK